MTILANNPVLVALAARATRARITSAEITAIWSADETRKRRDADRKRREREWNRVLGRRADGGVIRPIKETVNA